MSKRAMIDPLKHFNWQGIYRAYDLKCEESGRFEPNSPHLNCLGVRPASDRELYYLLIEGFSSERIFSAGASVETYEAMLYWKLYSQPAAVKNTCALYKTDSSVRDNAEKGLRSVAQKFYCRPGKTASEVLALFGYFDGLRIRGMQGSCSLPVRATFLHFLYPDVVPLFDSMVLRAVGVAEKFANEKKSVLREYLEHAWLLAERYEPFRPSGSSETVLRLVDMALWVHRGNMRPSHVPQS